ncbi:type II secretion system F family protein [Blastococcus sp. SYSU D00695]
MTLPDPVPVACLLAAAALLLWSAPPGRARARALARSRSPAPAAEASARGRPGGPRRRVLLAAVGGAGAALLLGGTVGVVAGLGAAVVVDRLLRRAAATEDRATEAAAAEELPVACDLLAVCLAAGLPPAGALGAVAAVLPGPLGEELAAVAARSRLGSAARAAWSGTSPEAAGLGRVLARAGESGSTVVAALQALAVDTRAAQRARTEARVRSAGVWVLAPLGACFLPAFVCLGVAPVVLGIAADVLP